MISPTAARRASADSRSRSFPTAAVATRCAIAGYSSRPSVKAEFRSMSCWRRTPPGSGNPSAKTSTIRWIPG
jgi:hypothetical protein